MRIELDKSTIFDSETGNKICDISELKDYGQALYIIELLLEDRQKAEEDYVALQEEYKLLENENYLLEETISLLEYDLNRLEYDFQMYKDNECEWRDDHER